KPIDEVNGVYGTRPNPLPITVKTEVIKIELRYSRLPDSFLNNRSPELIDATVLLRFIKQAKKATATIPISRLGCPSGKSVKLIPPDAISCTASSGKRKL